MKKRLHNLAHLIPTIRDSYVEASNAMGYYKGVPGGLVNRVEDYDDLDLDILLGTTNEE